MSTPWPPLRPQLCPDRFIRAVTRTLLAASTAPELMGKPALATSAYFIRHKTGAELVGTQTRKPFKGMMPRSHKAEGSFWLGRLKNPKQALLTESAIDALSTWTLVNPKQIDIIVSTAGTTQNLPKWMLNLKLNIIYCGFDDDKAGEQAAQSMISKYWNIQRLKPQNAKDWNEILFGKKINAKNNTKNNKTK